MNAMRGWFVGGMVCLLAAGCATHYHVPGAERIGAGQYRFSADGTALVEEPGEMREVTKAKVAAEAVARANLLKKIKGAYLTEDVSVADLMFESQEARLETAGWLSRAEIRFVEDDRSFDADEAVHARAELTVTRRQLDELLKFVE